jgi:hypothetical protein
VVQSAAQADTTLASQIGAAGKSYQVTNTPRNVQAVDFKQDGAPIPPIMPNPYNTPNCSAGKIVKLQGKVAIGALEIQAAIAAATADIGLHLTPHHLGC